MVVYYALLFLLLQCFSASAFVSLRQLSFPVESELELYLSNNMPMDPPPKSASSHSLYNLIAANRKVNEEDSEAVSAVPLAGIHDALSAKIFAQRGAPALFLSGFGVSASLLGVPDAGITSLVEMEQIARNVHAAIQSNQSPPLIVDGDTGYGGPGNMLRTISSLSNAGASAITIEDQVFPKKCTVAAGDRIRIVDRQNAVQRVRGALRARDYAGADAWIVARTDCRLAYGFKEVIERCLRFESLGAEIVYAENLQSIDEYQQLRARLDPRTITMVAQVQEATGDYDSKGKQQDKHLLDTKQIGKMRYDLALFGVTPLQCVIGNLITSADEFYKNNGLIGSNSNTQQLQMSDFNTVKQVVGFDSLESFERNYPS